MAMRSITEIFDKYAGLPALVIGGGPSALVDIPRLATADFSPALVLSANLHGLHQGNYQVDFLVNVDKVHCALRVPMEDWMRPYGIPIINAHMWSDYRLVNWTFPGNSGITAIAVACILGCYPVVCTGIDLFQSGRHYFHDAEGPDKAARPKTAPPSHYAQQRVKQLKQWSGDYPIRAGSGPLLTVFPAWTPGEAFKEPKPVKYRTEMLKVPTRNYRAIHTFSHKSNDRVRAGTVLPLSNIEAKDFLAKGWIVPA